MANCRLQILLKKGRTAGVELMRPRGLDRVERVGRRAT